MGYGVCVCTHAKMNKKHKQGGKEHVGSMLSHTYLTFGRRREISVQSTKYRPEHRNHFDRVDMVTK